MVVADGRFRRACTTIADNRAMFEWRLWLARSQMSSLRNEGEPTSRCYPSSARYTNLETGSGAEMSVVPDIALLAAGPHDQAHQRARDRAAQNRSQVHKIARNVVLKLPDGCCIYGTVFKGLSAYNASRLSSSNQIGSDSLGNQ